MTAGQAPRHGLPPADRARPLPLRLTPGRFWLWGVGLSVMSAIIVVGAPWNGFVDFPQFWSAGRTVGTPDLLDPTRHVVWQIANGVRPGFFAYPPGSAWLFAPFGALPLAGGFWLHAVAIGLISMAAGFVGARAFELDTRVALVATLAWAPTLAAIAVGQNAPLALLLALVAIDGLRRDRQALAGLAVGALLYKPTLAAPLLVLLLLRRQWTALAVAAAVAGAWYLLGVTATAGDWSWPSHWVAGLSGYYTSDTVGNVNKTISIPGFLVGHGAPSVVAFGAAALVAVAALPRLLRSPIAEAAAGACLIGLVVSPHSLTYEAVLVLPIMLWAVGGTGARIAEPWRTRLLVAAYLTAQLYVLTPLAGVCIFLATTLIATAVWLTGWQRQEAAPVSPPAEPTRLSAT